MTTRPLCAPPLWLAVLLHALLTCALVVADPAELHDDEILNWPTVAYEFNRGNISLSAIPLFLEARIPFWETLYIAGIFRLLTPSYPVVLFSGYLPALLILVLWHAVLRTAGMPVAAGWGALLLAVAPPNYAILSLHVGSPHVNLNLFLVLALLVYLRWGRYGRIAGLLPLAAVCLAGVSIVRAHWVAILLIGGLLVIRHGYRVFLRLAGCFLLLLPVKYLLPPFATLPQYSSPFHWIDSPTWELLHPETFVRFPDAIARIIADHAAVTTGYCPFAASIYLGLLVLAAGSILLKISAARRPKRDTELATILVLYPILYLLILVMLGFDSAFAESFLPAWRRYRYLVVLVPPMSMLLGIFCAALPRRVATVICLLACLSGIGSALHTWSFHAATLSAYPFTNYHLLGESIVLRYAAEHADIYRDALHRMEPAARTEAALGMGMAAVDRCSPPDRLLQAMLLLPNDAIAPFCFSAGYWSAHFRADDSVAVAVLSPAAWRHFTTGKALYALRPQVELNNLMNNRKRGEVLRLLLPRAPQWHSPMSASLGNGKTN